MREISAGTELSVSTVHKHKPEINVGNWLPELRVATPRILQKLSKKALDGDPKAVRLWLQYVEGWNPRDPNNESINTDVTIEIGYEDEES